MKLMKLRTYLTLAALTLISTLLLPAAARAATDPGLGTAGGFSVLAGSTVTNTGSSTVPSNLGVYPGTAVTGFPPGTVLGQIHAGDTTGLNNAQQAENDAGTAYSALTQPCTQVLTGQDLGGLTLTPGVYCFATAAQLTGTLTLDGQNDPNSVFIFIIGTTFTTASNAAVTVTNEAHSCGIFWQVGSSATLGSSTQLQGSILAQSSITLITGAGTQGGLYALSGAVTLDTNTIQVCSAAAPSTATTTATATATATTTPTLTATSIPVLTSTRVPVATSTFVPIATSTAIPLVSSTTGPITGLALTAVASSTATGGPISMPTGTAILADTATAFATSTVSSTASATRSPSATRTDTATRTDSATTTDTFVPRATRTQSATPTGTSVAKATVTTTATSRPKVKGSPVVVIGIAAAGTPTHTPRPLPTQTFRPTATATPTNRVAPREENKRSPKTSSRTPVKTASPSPTVIPSATNLPRSTATSTAISTPTSTATTAATTVPSPTRIVYDIPKQLPHTGGGGSSGTSAWFIAAMAAVLLVVGVTVGRSTWLSARRT